MANIGKKIAKAERLATELASQAADRGYSTGHVGISLSELDENGCGCVTGAVYGARYEQAACVVDVDDREGSYGIVGRYSGEVTMCYGDPPRQSCGLVYVWIKNWLPVRAKCCYSESGGVTSEAFAAE